MSSGSRLFGRTAKTTATLVFAAALAAGLSLSPADARLGGGSSFGSRGSRTFSMPSATATAPRVAPIGRSTTAAPFDNGFRNNGFAGAARPGFFGGGFGRGLIGGFLGAGLFGLLFGQGFGGGLGGGMSLIGLLLQLGLIFFIGRAILNYFRNRSPAYSNAGPGGGSGGGSGFGGMFGSGPRSTGGAVPPRPDRGVPITLGPDDYQAFEQRLVDSQAAYSNGDLNTLRRIATPEMAGNFQRELTDNDRQGVVNRISDVRLLQGDLSEAWREADGEYASVAMRFSLVDATIEKASGRVVDGNASAPQQVTEVWTFFRRPGSGAQGWLLSAIQQA